MRKTVMEFERNGRTFQVDEVHFDAETEREWGPSWEIWETTDGDICLTESGEPFDHLPTEEEILDYAALYDSQLGVQP